MLKLLDEIHCNVLVSNTLVETKSKNGSREWDVIMKEKFLLLLNLLYLILSEKYDRPKILIKWDFIYYIILFYLFLSSDWRAKGLKALLCKITNLMMEIIIFELKLC